MHAALVVENLLKQQNPASTHIVDLGSGSGILAKELTAHGFQVTGVDLSPSMIQLARENAPGATFHQTVAKLLLLKVWITYHLRDVHLLQFSSAKFQ